jgi:glycine oxidase
MTLVARSTGRIIAGGTVENAGFDKRTTAGSVQAILAMATAVMPDLKYATFAEAWAGLRPLTPDFLPVVGKVTDGLFVASGHYMTGIMSAPATIDAVAGLVTQGKSPLPIDAFSPHRFEPRHAETEVSV